MSTNRPTVVLIHGGFVDGSGWRGVYDRLRAQGHSVRIVQNPTASLADDVAVTRRVIAGQNGPVVLVGQSGGGSGIRPSSRATPWGSRSGAHRGWY